MDWQACLYIKVLNKSYCIKVFRDAISFERQSDGSKCLFERRDRIAATMYDTATECWDLKALAHMIIRCEKEIEVLNHLIP